MPPVEPTERCAARYRAGGDPLWGTAPRSHGWLLVTDPGPWASHPFEQHRLDPDGARSLAARASREGLRPLLIRRHGRTGHDQHLTWVDSRTLTVTSQPFTGFRDAVAMSSASLKPMSTPMYLVCTHGSRDACCAIAGRPVAEALQSLRPEATWECSHVGGHRFAANVVVLPYGLVYGAVTPADTAEIVAATESGLMVPRLLRGRCTDTSQVQAGRALVAELTQRWEIDGFTVTESVETVPAQWSLRFQGVDEAVDVTVTRSENPTMASCGAVPDLQPVWRAHLAGSD